MEKEHEKRGATETKTDRCGEGYGKSARARKASTTRQADNEILIPLIRFRFPGKTVDGDRITSDNGRPSQ